MSAAPRYPDNTGYAGLRMTADEYLALGETPERYELIDGVVVMSPSTSDEHSEIAVEVTHQLKVFAAVRKTIRVFADVDTRFAPLLVYRPDVMAYLAERLGGATKRRDLPPDLAVEVLSPGNRALDLVTKRRDYDRFGVGEYWIIDPETGHIRALQRRTPGESFTETLVAGPQLACTAIPGFALDLKPILAMIDAARRTSSDER